MGLFKIDFNKPGKGVEKEDLQKHRFLIFFDVLFRKFMKFVQLNLIYLIFSLPYLLILYVFSPLNATVLATVEFNGIGEFVKTLTGDSFIGFDLTLRLLFVFSVAVLWGTGPASAGGAYVMRNFAREEHAWVMSDFWDNVKSNFKQSMAVLFIDIVVIYLSMVAFNFYSMQYASSPNQIYLIAQGILAFVLMIYTFMHYYIYQLMISYEAALIDLYKNAMLFCVAKFPQNIFFTVLAFGIVLGLFVFLNVYALIAFVLIFTIVCKFIIEFYTSNVIRTTVIQK